MSHADRWMELKKEMSCERLKINHVISERLKCLRYSFYTTMDNLSVLEWNEGQYDIEGDDK